MLSQNFTQCSTSLGEGYQKYLEKLRRAASIRRMVPLPSFEEYGKAVNAEMDAQYSAMEMEIDRVRKAARRGALKEIPKADELLSVWRQSLVEALSADHKKVQEGAVAVCEVNEVVDVQCVDNTLHMHLFDVFLLYSESRMLSPSLLLILQFALILSNGRSASAANQFPGKSELPEIHAHASHYYALLFALPPKVHAEITIQSEASVCVRVCVCVCVILICCRSQSDIL